ncbi:holo-ACP synthase [Bacillaceae bacterium Marseille-Q3522]|nr:holo-ACP synthase [Bacillaceae bacterium Marseille-Q3522]
MISGIGIDIVEIQRIAMTMTKQKRFINRILTDNEQAAFHELPGHRQAEFLAGRFAAKEAFSKAIGTGIGQKLSFTDIEINNDKNGRPFIEKPVKEGVFLSISHTKQYAVAQVVMEKQNSKVAE